MDWISDDTEFVRLLIGDTDSSNYVLTDTQIGLLAEANNNNRYATAILAAESLAAKYAGATDARVGDVSVSNSQLSKQYMTLAATLRRRFAINTVAPYAGGISIGTKEAQEEDSDRVEPAFGKDLHKVVRGAPASIRDEPE